MYSKGDWAVALPAFYADAEGKGGIPAADALIAVYAAYYIGSNDREVKDNLNYNFNLRARNSFNMTKAMEQAFGRADSPFIVLDHLSDKRRDSGNKTEALHGAHFIALYHKESRRVMIALPGLESDDNPGDTLMDLKEMTLGGMRGQSRALYRYTKDIDAKIAAGAFKDAEGNPLPVDGGIVIGAHSMGCTAAQMMALDGYQTVLVEPRPLHHALLQRLSSNLAAITGAPRLGDDAVLKKLDDTTVNIRSGYANVWNSIILPWVKQREAGQNFSYQQAGHKVTPADRGIGTFHRVEVSVPSLNGDTEAKAYAGGVTLTPAAGHPRLLEDIGSRRKAGAIPGLKPQKT